MRNTKERTNNIFFIISIILIILTSTILYDAPWNYDGSTYIPIKAAIRTGATCSINDEPAVINGQLTEYGRQVLYECGKTDADIAQWQAEATTNGVSTNTNSNNEVKENNTTAVSQEPQNTNSKNKPKEIKQEKTYTNEEIEAAWVESNRVESTCEKAGYIEYTNSLTADTKKEDLPLSEHDYIEKSKTDATCTEEGIIIYECSVCGDTKEEKIPATGHITETTTTDAGLFSEGSTVEKCSVCGEIIAETIIPQRCPVSLTTLVMCMVIIIFAISIIILKRNNKQ